MAGDRPRYIGAQAGECDCEARGAEGAMSIRGKASAPRTQPLPPGADLWWALPCSSNTMAEEEEAATAPEEIVESLLAESGVVLGAPGVKKLVKELKVSAVSRLMQLILGFHSFRIIGITHGRPSCW